MKQDTKNEDIEFVYIQTYAGVYEKGSTESEWLANLKKAKNMNLKRFYHWINDDNFQLMRLPEIKKEFCTISKGDVE